MKILNILKNKYNKKSILITCFALLVLISSFIFWNNQHRLVSVEVSDFLLKNGKEVKIPQVNISGWKIFRDKKLGISFKYPKNLVINTKGNDNFSSIDISDSKDNEVCVKCEKGYITHSIVSILQISQQATKEAVKANHGTSFGSLYVKELKKELDKNKDITYIKISDYVYVYDYSAIIVFDSPEQRASVSFYDVANLGDAHEKNKDIFYGIIQTLKFK